MKEESSTSKEALELEPKRSGGGSGKASLPTYDSQVPEIPRRRRFTKEQKLKIIRELEQCKIHGGKGIILRREGIYSTQISQWKAQLGSSKKKKSKSSSDKNEIARLKRENARLKAKLEKSEKLIEIQKKMAQIIDDLNSKEKPSE